MGKCEVYVGCKMTGLYCDDLIDEALDTSVYFEEAGLSPYHPVLKERLPYEHIKLKERTPEEMEEIWETDKQAIKRAHVVVDTAPHLFSAGLKEEMGKARYRDWKPTVAIYPEGYNVPHIPRTERDLICYSPQEAAFWVEIFWGSRWKRMLWRLPIYLENWQSVSVRKLVEFFR